MESVLVEEESASQMDPRSLGTCVYPAVQEASWLYLPVVPTVIL